MDGEMFLLDLEDIFRFFKMEWLVGIYEEEFFCILFNEVVNGWIKFCLSDGILLGEIYDLEYYFDNF